MTDNLNLCPASAPERYYAKERLLAQSAMKGSLFQGQWKALQQAARAMLMITNSIDPDHPDGDLWMMFVYMAERLRHRVPAPLLLSDERQMRSVVGDEFERWVTSYTEGYAEDPRVSATLRQVVEGWLASQADSLKDDTKPPA